MVESDIQGKVIKEIITEFPTAIVMKNDARYLQGVPDFVVLYHNVWILIEFKQRGKSSYRPNQEYYLDLAKRWSFGYTIHKDNWETIKPNLFYILHLAEKNNVLESIPPCEEYNTYENISSCNI